LAEHMTAVSCEDKLPNENVPKSERLLVLEAGRTERLYWVDLWHYRELFEILAWRDVAVYYKQTVVGITWAVLRPLLTMVIFTVVFGQIAQLPTDGKIPYAVLVFTGMLPWTLFATILSEASSSLVSNSHLIQKVYFPRLVIPSAKVVVALVDFLINLVLLFALMIWYGIVPGWQIILLPVFTGIVILASIGPALLFTALNVRYRDFRFVIPFIVQFGLYISPVGYSSSVIPEKWQLLYGLNPMVGVIDGFRWCLLGGESKLNLPGFVLSIGIAAAFLGIGISYFRKTEKTFADLI
jgi:lipopolysaccharide transport system permease protein